MSWLRWPPVLLLIGMLPGIAAYLAVPVEHRPPRSIHAIRWILGIVFLVSGIAKLLPGFPNTMGPPDLELALARHGLGLLGRFVAVGEVGIGFLLLTRRFATIGALALAPMLIGILVTVISLEWVGTPYVVGGMLALDLVLLAYDHPKLLPLIGERGTSHSLPATAQALRPHAIWLITLGVLLVTLGVVRTDAARAPGVTLLLGSLIGLGIVDWRSRP